MTGLQPAPAAPRTTASTRHHNGPGLSVRRSPLDPGRPIDYATLSASEEADADTTDGGRAADYESGYADGERAAREAFSAAERQHAARIDAAVSALRRAADAARTHYERRSDQLERAVPQFAFEILEELVGRESILAEDPGRDAVARALALDESAVSAVVRLSPVDAATVADLADLAPSRALTVVADPTVERGGALVEVGTTTIDSQLSSALERVRAVVLGHPAGVER